MIAARRAHSARSTRSRHALQRLQRVQPEKISLARPHRSRPTHPRGHPHAFEVAQRLKSVSRRDAARADTK